MISRIWRSRAVILAIVACFISTPAARVLLPSHAVKAGVTMSISNGPVEGHIHRLKMLKRQIMVAPR